MKDFTKKLLEFESWLNNRIGWFFTNGMKSP